MPVPTLISQLSTTASLNSPDGAVDVPSSIDDYQRAHAAFIAQLYAGTVAAPTVIVPSATTTDIGAAASENVDISGNTTITGFGTVAEGINRKGRFTGVLTLTHNATSLILPGNANITTAANDRYEARSLGGGNWIVTKYQYASGYASSLTASGYQKLPGGLIIQWGTYLNSTAAANTYYTFNFPIAFPNSALQIVGSNVDGITPSNTAALDTSIVSNSQGKVSWSTANTHRILFIVIGY